MVRKTALKPKTPKAGKATGTQATITQPFDIIPGTKVDERFLPWILNLVLLLALGLICRAGVFPNLGARLAGTVMICAGLGFIAWRILDEAAPRTRHVRERLAAQFAWAALGLSGTILLGTLRWWLIVIEFGGALMALWWATAATSQVRGHGKDDHQQQQGDKLAEELGWGRVTARVIEDTEDRRRVVVEHRDVTRPAIRDGLGLISARFGLPETGMRALPDPKHPDDSGRTEITLVKRDVLTKSTLWPGPSRPGTSCVEPSRIGIYEDGSDLELVRPGAGPRPAIHILSAGKTGAGKTEGELCEVAELVTRTDPVIWWADIRKPGQTVIDVGPAFDWIATNNAEVKAMVRALLAVITARADWLGAHGYRQWEPGCGLPYLIAHIEEASAVSDLLGEDLTNVAETARSAGVSISLTLPRASFTRMSTDVRAQLVAWAFGCRSADDAAMVLSDAMIEAGAHPEAWGSKKPGYCYLEASHVDEEKHVMPARTFLLPSSVLRNHIAEWAPRMAKLDSVSAKAAGVAYAKRTSGLGWAMQRGWVRTGDGLLVPPSLRGDRKETAATTGAATYAETKSRAAETAAETAVETVLGTVGETVPETKTVVLPAGQWTERPAGTDTSTGGDIDEEDIELEDAKRDAAVELAAELPIDDPELIADIRAAGDPDQELPPGEPAEDFELWNGVDGPAVDLRGKVAALAVICDRLTAGERVEVKSDRLVEEWLNVPGMTRSQRPAMYELLGWLEAEGQAEDPGRGRWILQASAGDWLRAHPAGPRTATGGDDDDPPAGVPARV